MPEACDFSRLLKDGQTMTRKKTYRIFFASNGKAYELYARQVASADIYGFVEISGLLFGETASVLLNPAEESLKKEFEGVDRILLPYHQVSRIDEVDREGRGKVVALPVAESSSESAPPAPPAPR